MATTGERYRFGTFEANPATGELRRQGMRVKLSAQPFQVLALLLSHAGELLSRDEIARELWPDGTFVDFEQGVNSAVNRIREALGDSASNPRFVETVARKGYRFVAPVERVGSALEEVTIRSGGGLATESVEPERREPAFTDGILASTEELPQNSHRLARTLFLALQLMYVAFYVGALANLPEIEELLEALPQSSLVFFLLIATAAVLIPARSFVISAVFLHPPGARAKILTVWWYLLPFDLVWALSPFLLLHHINFGVALACTSLLVYSPFAQRSLVLMGASDARGSA